LLLALGGFPRGVELHVVFVELAAMIAHLELRGHVRVDGFVQAENGLIAGERIVLGLGRFEH
jgi:hypothetical protein